MEDVGCGESCSWGRRLYCGSDRRLVRKKVGSLGLITYVR